MIHVNAISLGCPISHAALWYGRLEKRAEFHRRRGFNGDGDINYINDRNMKFNQKLDRFYSKYTKDIKDNLERGTAI